MWLVRRGLVDMHKAEAHTLVRRPTPPHYNIGRWQIVRYMGMSSKGSVRTGSGQKGSLRGCCPARPHPAAAHSPPCRLLGTHSGRPSR